MQENLLTRITTTIGSRQAEDVASGALVYLLERYPQARVAFIRHLKAKSGIPVSGELRFTGQAKTVGYGITDISGVRGGVEEVIVEAKIAAGLHGQQITRYLRRLRGEHPLLVVLVPRDREAFIWHAVCEQALADPTGPVARAGDVTLLRTTWEEVIEAIATSLSDDPSGAAELDQVRGLYRHIEQSAFIPFTDDDLSAAAGRSYQSLIRLITQVLASFKPGFDPHAEFPGNLTGGRRGTVGKKGTVGGVRTWCGFWPKRWADVVPTPLWLSFSKLGPLAGPHLVDVIERIDQGTDIRPQAVFRPGSGDVIVPLYVPVGVDEAIAQHQIAQRIRDIGQAISAAGLSAEAPFGADAEPEDDDPSPD